MPKYNFYNAVYRYNSGIVDETIWIAKSKQFVKKTLLKNNGVTEVLKIDKVLILENYREEYISNIKNFIFYSKLKKFKIIIFNPKTEETKITIMLAESKREIYAKYKSYKVFYVSAETPSFEEYCEYYFE
ncbi:MAG: hypothetical protein IKG27_05760 [Bacilli bacterium]|nr:hypothetical protein [Bacilli bacterium]